MFQTHESTTLQPCRVFKAHKDYLTRLLLSPDVKNLATCSADHTVRIWKIDPAEEYLEKIPDLEKSDSSVSKSTESTASFDTNSQINGSMNLKKTDSRILNGGLRGSNGFSDGADSFRRSDIDVITQRRPLPSDIVLENHQRWVWDCAFSADSAYVVSGTLLHLISFTFPSPGRPDVGSEFRSHCPIMGVKSTEDDPSILWSS